MSVLQPVHYGNSFMLNLGLFTVVHKKSTICYAADTFPVSHRPSQRAPEHSRAATCCVRARRGGRFHRTLLNIYCVLLSRALKAWMAERNQTKRWPTVYCMLMKLRLIQYHSHLSLCKTLHAVVPCLFVCFVQMLPLISLLMPPSFQMVYLSINKTGLFHLGVRWKTNCL